MDEDDVNVRYVDAAGSAAEPIRPSLWSSRLPPHVQAIIMSQTSDTLEAVAELADRICEVTPARVQQIASTGNNTNCDASLLKRIDEIVTARIRTEIANHVAQIDRQREAITRPPTLEQLARAQQHDTELEELLVTPSNSLKLKPTAIPDALRGALEAPYTGPHKVISRSDKTITIHTNRGPVTVSIDRVKPGYVLAENRQEMSHSHVQKDNARYTRSGRRVKFTDFFQNP
ncbi:hypothetical protein ACJJTC_016848 [Scirpophaga incertulas]